MNAEEKMKQHYYPRLEKYRETHEILDWENRKAQFARFRVLIENVNLEGKTVLDVGCGCGDLFDMLNDEGISTRYTGIDILEGMVEKARELHSDGRFLCGDIFRDSSACEESYDVVFTSGIFNLNLGNNMEFFLSAVTRFSEIAREYLVLNLLDESSPDRDNRYFYFNPEDTAIKIEKHGWDVKIIKGYLDNDFTLVCRRIKIREIFGV